MSVVLRSWSRSFATRERARELASVVLDSGDARPTIDFAGVMVSPSFLAEFLQCLVEGGRRPVLAGLDDFQARMAERLINQLHLGDSVDLDNRLAV